MWRIRCRMYLLLYYRFRTISRVRLSIMVYRVFRCYSIRFWKFVLFFLFLFFEENFFFLEKVLMLHRILRMNTSKIECFVTMFWCERMHIQRACSLSCILYSSLLVSVAIFCPCWYRPVELLASYYTIIILNMWTASKNYLLKSYKDSQVLLTMHIASVSCLQLPSLESENSWCFADLERMDSSF